MRDHERELVQINSYTENDDINVYSKHPKEDREETWRKIDEDRNNLLLVNLYSIFYVILLDSV